MKAFFDTWQEAYDYCREADHPVKVRVGLETAKIYPSGSWKTLFVGQEPCFSTDKDFREGVSHGV